jgi:hypothetical protein
MDRRPTLSRFGQDTVSLRALALPDFGVSNERPELPEAEYERRIAAVREAVDSEWVVVYGDREHFANLAYLTGFDPRFEEAVLVLGPENSRHLLVGNEGLDYGIEVAVPRLDMVLCQSLSLMGQDRSKSPSLRQCLSDIGIRSGDRIGVVGWKYFSPEEWEGPSQGIAVPAFLLDTLRDLVRDDGVVEDVTAALLAPDEGLRSRASADQIAIFEWAASRATRAVMRVVSNTRPGITELEAISFMGYEGEPLSAHIMFASGSGEIVGLRSPTARTVREGDAVTTAIGYWGGLGCRAGLLRSGEDAAFTRAGSALFPCDRYLVRNRQDRNNRRPGLRRDRGRVGFDQLSPDVKPRTSHPPRRVGSQPHSEGWERAAGFRHGVSVRHYPYASRSWARA